MSAVLNQQPGLMPASFYALNAPHNRRLMKGFYPLLQQLLVQHPAKRLVVTGFISRNNAGETVLLGRNGSDYSATQIGALAGVSRVTI